MAHQFIYEFVTVVMVTEHFYDVLSRLPVDVEQDTIYGYFLLFNNLIFLYRPPKKLHTQKNKGNIIPEKEKAYNENTACGG